MFWLRRFFTDLIGAHVDGVRAILALPLLFALLIGWEFAQHVMEYRTGFFESEARARAVASHPSRMALGWIKMLSIYLGGFFVIRHLAGRRAALAPIGTALLRYAPYILYALLIFALVFYATAFIPRPHVNAFRLGIGLAQIAIEPLLMPWIVSAASDGAVRSPLASARLTGRLYFWGLALFFVGRIPVNAAHQVLNLYAIGRPGSLLWPMLIVDAIVVGLIIAVIPALYVRISGLVRERRLPIAAV